MNKSVNYPYTTFNFGFKYVENFLALYDSALEVRKDAYYSTFFKYQLFTTNLKYTEANIKRIQTYMRNTEKYDGALNDNEDSDIGNWRSHFDIGTSQQSSPVNDEASRWYYYISQGNFNLASQALPSETDDPKAEAYGYAYPYHPFPDKCPIRATSRSDIPDIGYTRLYLSSENIEQDITVGQGAQKPIMTGLYALAEFTEAPPHFFKNNKNQDASIAFCSKYDSDWKTKLQLGDISSDDVELIEADSLSKQYNVGCYPVQIYPTDAPKTLYNIQDTYWVGQFGTGPADFQTWLNSEPESFTFKFEAGHDADHQQYGGSSLYVWDWQTAQWEVQQDAYIYSFQNRNVKDGRDPVQGVAFDGIHNVDLENSSNQFAIDFANDKRFIMVFWDETNLSHCNIYQLDGFSGNGFYPFGGDPVEWAPPYPAQDYEVRVTDMYVASSNPGSIYHPDNVTGINDQAPQPFDNTNNQPETVCAFLLYADSATKKSDGSWDISSDFALPVIHQGMFCVSPSFLDNPAVWLTNAGLYNSSTTIKLTEGATKDNENINYIMVGANNCTFTFDNSLSRCTFTNLHTTKRLGVQDMPTDDNGDLVTTTIGEEVIKVNDTIVKNGYYWKMYDAYDSDNNSVTGDGTNRNSLLNYAIGGVYIHEMYGESSIDNNTDLDNMTLLTDSNWADTLLHKLGFRYTDLFPKFGLPTNIYDYSKINSTNPDLRYEKLKPMTTNPLIDISSSIDLPQQDFTNTDSAGAGDPLYTLSVGPLLPVNLDGSVSEKIAASDLPVKQSTPFYLIYCNLSNGVFIENQDTFN